MPKIALDEDIFENYIERVTYILIRVYLLKNA
jgi:hypothetical protein